MTHQDGTLRVDAQRLPEVEFRQLEPLLFVVGEADAVPSVVMPSVDPDGRPEAGKSFLQLLDDDVLVAEQGVSICEVGVNLKIQCIRIRKIAIEENLLGLGVTVAFLNL